MTTTAGPRTGGTNADGRVAFATGAASLAAGELIGEGILMAALCGAGGMVLGILAFVGIQTMNLIPVTVLVFGTALMVVTGTTARLSIALERWPREQQRLSPIVGDGSVPFAPAPTLIIALTGIVLGIMALSGHAPITLSLISLLSLAVGVALTGTTLATTLARGHSSM
jgi:hypothetical protein